MNASSPCQSVRLAETLDHPPSLAHALIDGVMVHQIARDRDATLRMARRTLELADKYSFGPQQRSGSFLYGWAQASGPDLAAGLAIMESQFAGVPFPGALRLYFTAVMAEVRAAAGRVDEALKVLDEAREQEPGVGFYLPEIHRVRGDCLALIEARRAEAMREFDTALELAGRQGAHLLRLRAAAGKLRLMAATGHPEAGITSLREILAMFTEGSAAPDLVEARALLDRFGR